MDGITTPLPANSRTLLESWCDVKPSIQGNVTAQDETASLTAEAVSSAVQSYHMDTWLNLLAAHMSSAEDLQTKTHVYSLAFNLA